MTTARVKVFPSSIPLKDLFDASFGRFTNREPPSARVTPEGKESHLGNPILGLFCVHETSVSARHAIPGHVEPTTRREKGGDESHTAVKSKRGHPITRTVVEIAVGDQRVRQVGDPVPPRGARTSCFSRSKPRSRQAGEWASRTYPAGRETGSSRNNRKPNLRRICRT